MPRDTLHRIQLLSVGAALCLALICSRPAKAGEALNFPPSDFEILNAETGDLIGHAHYKVDQTPDSLTLHGESRYLNGEYDLEDDRLTLAGNGAIPTLQSFRHDFFDADGSRSIVASLDIKTGEGVCGRAEAGKMNLSREQIKFPADSFAGASVLIPIQEFVSRGVRGSMLKLHVFNCAPTPKMIAVDVKPEAARRAWTEYPGELDKIDVKANLGFWTIVLAPFIPKLAVWFDPSQDMLIVGAQLQRYYKGTKIILVRKREATLSKAPTVAGVPPP